MAYKSEIENVYARMGDGDLEWIEAKTSLGARRAPGLSEVSRDLFMAT
jgi:hypothetical protein